MRRLSELNLHANGFAFDPSFGESFLLNESAIIALQALKETGIQGAAGKLAMTYGIAENEALSDLFNLVAKLRILGFEVE